MSKRKKGEKSDEADRVFSTVAHVPEISRSTRMSLINGVPLNEDTLSVNDKFFPTIKDKRKPAQVRDHLSFRGRNGRGFGQVEVVFRDGRRENRAVEIPLHA